MPPGSFFSRRANCRWRLARIFAVATWLTGLVCALAEEPNLPPPEPAAKWRLESIRLRDGRELRGLIADQRDGRVDFAQIMQPAGRPMHAILRGLEPAEVVGFSRLPPREHAELLRRFQSFRNRSMIEAGRIEQVQLVDVTVEGVRYRQFTGAWFTLLSTTDEALTRRCVVRAEQMFLAYRTLLPPRAVGRRDLKIYLFSSLDEYRQRLKSLEIAIANPAFYSARHQLILAGSEWADFAERLSQARQEGARLEQELQRLEEAFQKGLARLGGELKEEGYSREEIAEELTLRKTKWSDERKQLAAQIRDADRRNEAHFAEVTRDLFARLYHEMFHAYLHIYAFPGERFEAPRWLNEGLAQAFETGQLDGDTLRIDAPDRQRLLALQTELKSSSPLPLAALLESSDSSFLGEHPSLASQRHYLYSWGLAYYLVFQENLLTSAALENYLAPTGQPADPTARLERLVGMPLAEFETKWRAAMLRLRPAAK